MTDPAIMLAMLERLRARCERALRIIEGIFASARSGGWQALPGR